MAHLLQLYGAGENSTLVEKRVDGPHVEDTWKFGSGRLIGKGSISKNGKTMTYTLTGSDGKRVHEIQIWEKQ
jgi:hypothetical protein